MRLTQDIELIVFSVFIVCLTILPLYKLTVHLDNLQLYTASLLVKSQSLFKYCPPPPSPPPISVEYIENVLVFDYTFATINCWVNGVRFLLKAFNFSVDVAVVLLCCVTYPQAMYTRNNVMLHSVLGGKTIRTIRARILADNCIIAIAPDGPKRDQVIKKNCD